MKDRFLDWIFDTFGKRFSDKTYIGHGDFIEERMWELKIFNKVFIRSAEQKEEL